MSVVKVEVFYKDGLCSICINHREMEGTTILKDKPIAEWFGPIAGRASWKGLREEIEEQNESGRMEKTSCFIFHGPEELRRQFQENISSGKIGRMAEPSEIEETAQEYMEIAEQREQIGDIRGAMQAYCIAADWYHLEKAEFVCGNYYASVLQDEKGAAEYFRRAAQQGYADAQYCYGKCLEDGMGVLKNEEEAVVWYQKAAAQGQEDALQELEQRRQVQEEARQRKEKEQQRQKEEEEAKRKERELQVQAEAGKQGKSEKRITLDKVELTALKILTTPVSMQEVPRSARDGVVIIKGAALAVELGVQAIRTVKTLKATNEATNNIDWTRFAELLDDDDELGESDNTQS